MLRSFKTIGFLFVALLFSCGTEIPKSYNQSSFTWDNATVYFLLTDRFYNGDVSNDFIHPEGADPAPYRGFMGGDLRGVITKLEEGYFDSLGINAIWMTPVVENIVGSVDEGTGRSYGFHGYWTRDWTAIDQRIGTKEDLEELVEKAHQRDIRVLLDVVINHTGPVTETDSQWPDSWVKTGPKCEFSTYKNTTDCTLVENLPDIRTESTQEVELPKFLIDKWKKEGRYEEEIAELDAFFKRTGYPRLPHYYIIKWTIDYIEDFGVDGFRVDTVKHTEGFVWEELWKEAKAAFERWKKQHPEKVMDDNEFYMVGEVYNFYASQGRDFDYGDRKVDFFDQGFHAMINFDFKSDAHNSYEEIFTKYDTILHNALKGKSVVNYISSHDDGGPFDKERKKSIESGTKLLLSQGGAQIYYGDETSRSLSVEADGDATLRSFMNWEEFESQEKQEILKHWQKLGRFRKNHSSVGAGKHTMLSEEPYVFSRSYEKDKVVVSLGLNAGEKTIDLKNTFEKRTALHDYYSNQDVSVEDGKVTINSPYSIVLLGQK